MSSIRTLICLILVLFLVCSPIAYAKQVSVKTVKHGKKIVKIISKKHTVKKIHIKKASANTVKVSQKIASINIPLEASTQKALPVVNVRNGKLFVYSKHKELDVYLDEEIAGKTPLTLDKLSKGRHVVEAYMGPELYYRQYVDIEGAKPVVMEINGIKEIAAEDPSPVM